MEGGGGAAVAQDEDLASMEEKRAAAEICNRDRGIDRVPFALLGHGGGGGGGVRGWEVFTGCVVVRGSETRKPSRRPRTAGRVGSGRPGAPSFWSFFKKRKRPSFFFF